jgi:hypothetical protein
MATTRQSVLVVYPPASTGTSLGTAQVARQILPISIDTVPVIPDKFSGCDSHREIFHQGLSTYPSTSSAWRFLHT